MAEKFHLALKEVTIGSKDRIAQATCHGEIYSGELSLGRYSAMTITLGLKPLSARTKVTSRPIIPALFCIRHVQGQSLFDSSPNNDDLLVRAHDSARFSCPFRNFVRRRWERRDLDFKRAPLQDTCP